LFIRFKNARSNYGSLTANTGLQQFERTLTH
jgi:hypothetical protein